MSKGAQTNKVVTTALADPAGDLVAAIRRAARQEQFLEVVSAEEAKARFARHLDLSPLPGEKIALHAALGRVLAQDVAAPIDVPPFDRANVDGFALRAADTLGAGPGTPKRLALNREVIACGVAPAVEVAAGTATAIATGGVIPRGADAVVMIEHTELIEDGAAPAIASHASRTGEVPDPIDAVPGYVAGFLVLGPGIERFALVGPLFTAVVAVDERKTS